jgi:Cu+-exporting ATPase
VNAPDVQLAVPETDPVCGMEVQPGAAPLIYDGKTYHFCSQGCLTKFQAYPEKYAAKATRPEALTQASVVPTRGPHVTEYTCPMHPQIIRSAPGDCPICGMALEPRTASAGE